MSIRALSLLPSSAVANPFTKSTRLTGASTQYITFGNNLDQTGSGSFSISIWVKPATNPAVAIIAGKISNTSNTPGYGIETQSGTVNCFIQGASGGPTMQFHIGTLSTGTWSHLVWVSTGILVANQTFYLNGASQSLTTSSNNMSGSASNSTSYIIGVSGNLSSSRVFDGQVSHHAFFNGTALTSGNVTTLYNSGHVSNISALSPTVWNYLGDGDNASSAGGFIDQQATFAGTGNNTPTFVTDVP